MANLDLWEKVRAVPDTAQREITGGHLNGKTDINPVWRIKTLTDQFGICGFGWKAPITKAWLETGTNGEIVQYCQIELFIKVDGQWSEAITGVGGSMLIEKNTKGLYTNDEALKMAYTDAISVACKALGIGADVYWSADKTKYDGQQQQKEPEKALISKEQVAEIQALFTADRIADMLKYYKIDALEKLSAETAADIITRRKKQTPAAKQPAEPAAEKDGVNNEQK